MLIGTSPDLGGDDFCCLLGAKAAKQIEVAQNGRWGSPDHDCIRAVIRRVELDASAANGACVTSDIVAVIVSHIEIDIVHGVINADHKHAIESLDEIQFKYGVLLSVIATGDGCDVVLKRDKFYGDCVSVFARFTRIRSGVKVDWN